MLFLAGLIVGFILCLICVIVWVLRKAAGMKSRKEETGDNMEYPEPKCWNCRHRNTPEGFWRCDQCVEGSLWEPDDKEENS